MGGRGRGLVFLRGLGGVALGSVGLLKLVGTARVSWSRRLRTLEHRPEAHVIHLLSQRPSETSFGHQLLADDRALG